MLPTCIIQTAINIRARKFYLFRMHFLFALVDLISNISKWIFSWRRFEAFLILKYSELFKFVIISNILHNFRFPNFKFILTQSRLKSRRNICAFVVQILRFLWILSIDSLWVFNIEYFRIKLGLDHRFFFVCCFGYWNWNFIMLTVFKWLWLIWKEIE